MQLVRLALINLAFTLALPVVAGQVAESSLVPSRVLLDEDFELGDLEDPALPRIERIHEYLTIPWEPQVEGYPKFMTPSLQRLSGALDSRGRRYLRYPVLSGDAAIRSPTFSLKPWMRIRISADLLWEGIGQGAVHVGIRYSTGERVSLLSGSGEDSGWQARFEEKVVPTGVVFGQVEIWIEGDHTRNRGEYGFDNIRVESLPNVLLRSTRETRRVDPIDDTPFVIHAVGFPQGEYDLETVFKNQLGKIVHRMSQHKFVRPDHQVAFKPSLRWQEYGLARGQYTIEVVVRSDKGWSLGDRGTFVLAGPPAFSYQGAPGRWGLALNVTEEAPVWLNALGPIRCLSIWRPELGVELPNWVKRVGAHRRSIVLDPESEWAQEELETILPLRHTFPSWYWIGDRETGEPLLSRLVSDAPYIRAGQRVTFAEMSSVDDRRVLLDILDGLSDPRDIVGVELGTPSFDVWVSGDVMAGSVSPSASLAATLYLVAAKEPQTVFLSQAEKLFVEPSQVGEVIPTPAMLTWEFVTGFLSDAKFVGFVSIDPGAIVLAFDRDSETYLVGLSREDRVEVALFAGEQVTGYDATGNSTVFKAEEDGRVRILLTPEPQLLAGVDVNLVRTVRSFELSRRSSESSRAQRLPLDLSMTNFYSQPVEVTLDLRYPPDWPGVPEFETRAIEAGKSTVWPFDVEVPKWFGTEDRREVYGDLVLGFGDRSVRVPISRELPMASDRIIVTLEKSPGKLLTVKVTNKSNDEVRISLFMEVEPIGRNRRFATQRLASGEHDRFSIAIDGRPEGGKLFVGIVDESSGEHINQVFPLD